MSLHEDGLKSRQSRLKEFKSGAWGSFSQDFARLAYMLFEHSLQYAKQVDGNCSIYSLAGIPVLFSALRCLLIELNDGMHGAGVTRPDVLRDLAHSSSDVSVILAHYAIPDLLRERLNLLVQVRHEIVHPSHRPSGEPNNTPAYLRYLRDARLLQSTEKEVDYPWLAQLQSHRLFRWTFEVIQDTVDALLCEHDVTGLPADGLRGSYSRYEKLDAAAT